LAPLLLFTALIVGCGGGSSGENTTEAANVDHTASVKLANSTQPTPATGPITVSLTEWSVTAARSTAKAGKVVFTVTNAGTVIHEMVVVRTSKRAANLADGKEASEDGSVDEVADLKPGQTKTLSLHLKPGHYALICNEPGHYMSGMHTDFTVTRDAPASGAE
jgi:uncharacterized cupredoxin-like copper-binding protein